MANEQQRLTALITGTIAAAAVVALTYWARSVLIPIALAILMSFVLAPIVTRFHRRGLNRFLAVTLTVSLVMAATFGIGLLLSRQVMQLAETLPDRRDAIKEKLAAAKRSIVGEGHSRFGQLIDEVTEIIAPTPSEEVLVVKTASPSIGQKLETYVSPAAELLAQAAFTFILTVFILLRREDLRNRAIRLIGDRQVMATTKAVDDASRRISRYLLSQLILNVAFGAVITLGMLVFQVPYAILWGVIAGLLRYVPYIGTWVGLILPLAFSVTTAPAWGDGWGQPIAVLVLYLALELLYNNYLEPRVFGQSMGISEVAQVVAAATWAFLWGPIGLILSGPLTACLLVLGRHVARFRFLVVLLGDEPPLSPMVAFYQRLAARDQDEASEVAHAAAKETSTEECYERVLVPALCRARIDAAAGDLDRGDLTFIVNGTEEVAVELAEPREPAAGDDKPVRLLVCPAREKAEKVAADIFATMLDPARWEVRVTGDEVVAGELVALVAEFQPAAIVIVAMPPGGISHANYLVARLKRGSPDIRVFVGRWGGDPDESEQRANALKGIKSVAGTLAESRKQLEDLHAVLKANAANPAQNNK